MKMPHEYRHIVDSTCLVCGQPIRGIKRKRYCNERERPDSPNRCRQAAKYKRQQKDDKAYQKVVQTQIDESMESIKRYTDKYKRQTENTK